VEILLTNNADAVASHSQRGRQKKRQPLTREQLLVQLNDCDWNKAEVARRLGLSHTSIWKYMKKWDIPLRRTI
jgi:transcriptional regulator of acetoin/glycerol metabolism